MDEALKEIFLFLIVVTVLHNYAILSNIPFPNLFLILMILFGFIIYEIRCIICILIEK